MFPGIAAHLLVELLLGRWLQEKDCEGIKTGHFNVLKRKEVKHLNLILALV
jgi:hypothetical protein